MDRTTFESMAQRRGYTVEDGPNEVEQNNLPSLHILRGGEVVCRISLGVFEDRETETVIAFFDEMVSFHRKQHHMVCLRCKEPLLRCLNIDLPSSPSTPVAKPRTFGHTMYYEYRSAKAGPDSPMLLACPGCRAMLDVGNVGEITDEAPAWFEEEVLRRYAGETRSRRALHGNFLEEALQEEEGPDRTKQLSLTFDWNVPIVEDAQSNPGGSWLSFAENMYAPITLPLKDTFLPDRPSDIMFENTLMQMMFGQPLMPLNAAQIKQEVERRQQINKAFEEGDEDR